MVGLERAEPAAPPNGPTALLVRRTDAVTIGGGAGGQGAQVPNDGVVGTMHSGPPTLTPVDRNKAYCFHKLVLNLPAPLDIQ